MKLTMIEELNLPEDRRAAISRESLRTGKPAADLIREFVLQKSEELIAAKEHSEERPSQAKTGR